MLPSGRTSANMGGSSQHPDLTMSLLDSRRLNADGPAYLFHRGSSAHARLSNLPVSQLDNLIALVCKDCNSPYINMHLHPVGIFPMGGAGK